MTVDLKCLAIVAVLSIAAAGPAAAQPGRGRAAAPDAGDVPGVSPGEIQRMFDSYALMQAQDQLKIADDKFPQFLARFKALQDTRRRNLQERTRVIQELRKLVAYKASGSKLTGEVVTELLAGGREDEIFKLTDNLLPHPTPDALKIARGLYRGGIQPTSVAYRMARHVALVLDVRARQDRGETLADVKAGMTEHPFVLQKAFDVARESNADHLEAALKAIRDYEWEVKSGQVDAELGLDVLLTRL